MLVVRYKESPANYRTHLAVFFFFIITFYVPAQLVRGSPSATLWASRGHMCVPFPPPIRAFIFNARRVQHSRLFRVYARGSLSNFANSRSLALSGSHVFEQEKTREYALGRIPACTIDPFSSDEIHLLLHKGRLYLASS